MASIIIACNFHWTDQWYNRLFPKLTSCLSFALLFCPEPRHLFAYASWLSHLNEPPLRAPFYIKCTFHVRIGFLLSARFQTVKLSVLMQINSIVILWRPLYLYCHLVTISIHGVNFTPMLLPNANGVCRYRWVSLLMLLFMLFVYIISIGLLLENSVNAFFFSKFFMCFCVQWNKMPTNKNEWMGKKSKT